MARGMNHVYLLGAIARDPELRYTPQGLAICDLTVAGEDAVLGNDGQTRHLPWYHRVSFLGKPAEVAAEQLKVGQAVFVEGSLEQRSWEGPEGQKRTTTSIKGLRIDAVQRDVADFVSDAGGGIRLKNGINEAILVGNLGRDPELRYTSSGEAVAGFSIAVGESWKGRDGNWQEKTHWIDLNCWRGIAEAAAQLHKGDSILVTGRIKNDSWTDQAGQKRYSTKVEVNRFETFTRGPSATGSLGTTPGAGRPVAYDTATTAPKSGAGSRAGKVDIDAGLHDISRPDEEDLPF